MKFAGYLFVVGATLLSIHFLKQRLWCRAALALLFGGVWAVYYRPVIRRLGSFGIDSFVETHKFEPSEAIFYLSTLVGDLKPELHAGRIFGPVLVGALVYLTLRFACRRFGSGAVTPERVLKFAAVGMMGVSMVSVYAGPLRQFFDASDVFVTTKENFQNETVSVHASPAAPILVVYIGESTSVMNMGVYGYFRDTTPGLSKLVPGDGGAILFNDVFSTHTHTNASLLEALSVGDAHAENPAPINERKRLSIVDVINAAGLKSYVVSNQGQWGRDNQVSSIIFAHAESEFSIASDLGGRDGAQARPSDDVFFESRLVEKIDALRSAGRGAVFLHSYAGHGDYLDNIPADFRGAVDGRLAGMQSEAVFGAAMSSLSTSVVDAYDSAIRYVDYSVTKSIDAIRGRREPIVFVYFSDHGDSIYTNRGHDSSRFVHEMARVPFIMYFNDAARTAYPQLFEKYRSLSLASSVSTLAQLPAVIVDVLGIRVDHPKWKVGRVLGEPSESKLDPILVRRVEGGLSLVELDQPREEGGAEWLNGADSATSVYAAAAAGEAIGSKVCFHRSNTLGKALRGSLVADCLEFDVVVTDGGALSVHHPPQESVGLTFETIVDIANRRKSSLWIDAKNIDDPAKCLVLADAVEGSSPRGAVVTIEFPPGTRFDDPGLRGCATKLRSKGFKTSYYVPTERLKACAADLGKEPDARKSGSCGALDLELEGASRAGMFTNFSFDYSSVLAMETLSSGRLLRWNAWNVRPHELDKLKPGGFDMVILKVKDPNNR